jgi:hypothetical protein
MSRYKTLRLWSMTLVVLGVICMISASIGVASWAIAVDGFWDTLGVILFGAPVVLVLAAWPMALGQALRALADVGDAVSFDVLTAVPTAT